MKKTLTALCLSLAFGGLSAQVINIEDLRIKNDTVGWAGSGELSGYVYKSNDLVFTLLTDIHIQHKSPKTLWLFLTDVATVRVNGDSQFANSGFQHVRFNYKVTDKFVWEAFVQGLYNEPLSIDYRFLSGTGPRYKLMGTDKFRLYIAALYMFENEKNPGIEEIQYNHRMSSYVSFTIRPNDNVSIVSTTYYQPRLDDFSDRRLATNIDFKSYLTKKFYLTFNYSYSDDTAPAPGITSSTYELTTGIGFEL
ncbi:MAG: DUF481 domain-containing protein [Chitinophagales bacterium]